MKTEHYAIHEEIQCNPIQHLKKDERISPQATSNYSYSQSSILSSKELDSQEIKEASLPQLHYSNLGDTRSEIEQIPKTITIPDDLLKKAEADFSSKGHQDTPGDEGQIGVLY